MTISCPGACVASAGSGGVAVPRTTRGCAHDVQRLLIAIGCAGALADPLTGDCSRMMRKGRPTNATGATPVRAVHAWSLGTAAVDRAGAHAAASVSMTT